MKLISGFLALWVIIYVTSCGPFSKIDKTHVTETIISGKTNETPERINQVTLTSTSKKPFTPTKQITYTPAATLTQTLSIPLALEGPWVLVKTVYDGLWLLNIDGTGLTQIAEGWIYQFAVSPDQRTVAYVTDSNLNDDTAGLELMILSIPRGSAHTIASLQNSSFWTDFSDETLTDTEQAMRAILASPIAWSYDGSQIAFVSQAEGPSADLLVYNLKNKSISRLTDGPSQAYEPTWSLDGKYIFHTGIWNFGTGAGYVNAGSWIVPVDGSTIQQLPGEYGTDKLMEWISPTKILLASWSQPCGLAHLRTYDFTTSTNLEIWPYYFNDISASIPSNRIVILVRKDFSQCTEQPQPTGVFLFLKPSSSAKLISDQSFELIVPHPTIPDAFFIPATPQSYELSSSEILNPISDAPPAVPIQNPQSDLWLWDSMSYDEPGLWIGPSNLDSVPRKVITTFIKGAPVWEPSGTAFFFTDLDKGRLYVAKAPEYSPILVSDQLDMGGEASFVIINP